MSWTSRSAVGWVAEAAKRSGAFALSLICGIAIPLSTLGAEALVKGTVEDVAWYSAGVTYLAGVGLASKSRQVLLFMLIGAGALAFFYGVDLMAEVDNHPKLFSAQSARFGVAFASIFYFFERVTLHLINNRNFPE